MDMSLLEGRSKKFRERMMTSRLTVSRIYSQRPPCGRERNIEAACYVLFLWVAMID